MRTNDFTGVYHMMDMIDPVAIKVQRMAELADLAEFRKRKLDAVVAWSKPGERAKRIAQAEIEKAQAIGILIEREEKDPFLYEKMRNKGANVGTTGIGRWQPDFDRLEDRILIKPVPKPQRKPTWIEKLCLMLGFK